MKRAARTNRSGKPLEHTLEQLRQNGFAEIKGVKIKAVKTFPLKYIHTDAKYLTIYGTRGKHEGHIFADRQNEPVFLEEVDGAIQIIVECKFQYSSGSADEKIPYVIESFAQSDIKNWVLIMNGAWWTKNDRGKAIVRYAKERARNLSTEHKRLFVVTRQEFGDLVLRAWGNNHG